MVADFAGRHGVADFAGSCVGRKELLGAIAGCQVLFLQSLLGAIAGR